MGVVSTGPEGAAAAAAEVDGAAVVVVRHQLAMRYEVYHVNIGSAYTARLGPLNNCEPPLGRQRTTSRKSV